MKSEPVAKNQQFLPNFLDVQKKVLEIRESYKLVPNYLCTVPLYRLEHGRLVLIPGTK